LATGKRKKFSKKSKKSKYQKGKKPSSITPEISRLKPAGEVSVGQAAAINGESAKEIPVERRGRFDFVGKNKYWVMVSTAFIIVGIIVFLVRGFNTGWDYGFNFGIDFRGGNLIELRFDEDVQISDLRNIMEQLGYGNAILQSTENDQYIIRTTPLSNEEKELILTTLDEEIGITQPLIQDRNVAPGFSQTITRNALIAVAISIAGILIYVWIRFEVRFAVVAIIELLHDILIILSFYAITFREFNTTTIAVILTILGYSLSDAIIIFDRMREELRINRQDRFAVIINYSINKTLVRSLSTVGTTLLPVIILLIIGNETLKDFAFGLLIGILSGAYSSIFVGAPILIAWNNRFPKYKN
jgi:preprotein translocase SecF subunit